MGKDFLKVIVDHKKEEVAASKRRVPEKTLRDDERVRQQRRPFIKNLEHPGPAGINIIAEVKRASPSKGDIRPDLDPAVYAAAYDKGGAAAISVLTDQNFFKGSSHDLIKARAATDLPVLRKDFMITSYQIYEAAVMGADAVLLIVRILSKEQLRDYLLLCDELRLDALVEVHSEDDLASASLAGARLIGINNRNLSSFKTDIKTAMHMVSQFEPHQIPVAASGISGRADIEKNLEVGIYNFLIGESLVRADNTVAFIQSLVKGKG